MDAVFLQRQYDDALTKEEIQALLKLVNDEKVLPVELPGKNVVADGFVSLSAALKVDLDKFYDYIVEILNDVTLERPDCRYQNQGLNILIAYNIVKKEEIPHEPLRLR